MDQNKKQLIFSIILLLVLGVASYFFLNKENKNIIQNAKVISLSIITPENGIYEDKYAKVRIPAGWDAYEYAEGDDTSNLKVEEGAVSLSKGDYLLEIKMAASKDTTFARRTIVEKTPDPENKDAFLLNFISGTCLVNETHPAFPGYLRVDQYLSLENKSWECGAPAASHNIWYNSYIINDSNGYQFVNYYTNPAKSDKGYAIEMYFNPASGEVSDFPLKGSKELEASLAEMTNIIKNMEIKNK